MTFFFVIKMWKIKKFKHWKLDFFSPKAYLSKFAFQNMYTECILSKTNKYKIKNTHNAKKESNGTLWSFSVRAQIVAGQSLATPSQTR